MGKLQEQMKADLLLKRHRPNTTRAYLHYIRNFAKYFMRPPACIPVYVRGQGKQ